MNAVIQLTRREALWDVTLTLCLLACSVAIPLTPLIFRNLQVTILGLSLDFSGLRMWDVAAVMQALFFSIVLWVETRPNEYMKSVLAVGGVAILVGLWAAVCIGLGLERVYHFTLFLIVLLFMAGDILTYWNRDKHPLFLQLVFAIDLPLLLSYTLVVAYLDSDPLLDAPTRATFISGAVAFQLILATFAIFAMRLWWGKDKDAASFRERVLQYIKAVMQRGGGLT